MKIIAPSYRRAGGVLTHKILPEVIYAVHEFEAEDYRGLVPQLMVLPDELRGNIARVRNWIRDQFKDEDLLIIDDDIQKIQEYRNKDGKFYRHWLEGDELTEFIEWGFSLARQWGVRIWGVNSTFDKQSFREFQPFSTLSYISASWHGFVGCPTRYDERLPLKEDFDICLQEWNDHRRTLRINFVSMVKDDHGNTGGCAAYRNMQIEREQFDLLQRKWGSDIVRYDNQTRSKKDQGFDFNPILKPPIAGV
jgi:hypothetical protein